MRKRGLPLASVLGLILMTGCLDDISDKPKNSDPASREPICFLAGSMKQANYRAENNFNAMSTSIRIQLTARSKEECVDAGQAYCTAMGGRGYVPEELTLSFHIPERDPSTDVSYGLDHNCSAKRK